MFCICEYRIEEALNDFKFIEIIEGDGYEIKR